MEHMEHMELVQFLFSFFQHSTDQSELPLRPGRTATSAFSVTLSGLHLKLQRPPEVIGAQETSTKKHLGGMVIDVTVMTMLSTGGLSI